MEHKFRTQHLPVARKHSLWLYGHLPLQNKARKQSLPSSNVWTVSQPEEISHTYDCWLKLEVLLPTAVGAPDF